MRSCTRRRKGLDVADVSTIPKDLRRLIGRMLEKDRDLRPATAAEIAARLRAVQSGSMAGREYAAARPSSGTRALKVGTDVYRQAPPFTPQPAASSGLGAALASGNIRDVITVALLLVLTAAGSYAAYSWYRGRRRRLARANRCCWPTSRTPPAKRCSTARSRTRSRSSCNSRPT